jgi:hypothetical protein
MPIPLSLGLKIFLADTCRIALEKNFKEREMNPQPMTPRNHKKCIELTHLTSKKLTILVVLYKDRADQKTWAKPARGLRRCPTSPQPPRGPGPCPVGVHGTWARSAGWLGQCRALPEPPRGPGPSLLVRSIFV